MYITLNIRLLPVGKRKLYMVVTDPITSEEHFVSICPSLYCSLEYFSLYGFIHYRRK